jgi:hypothetical protein
MFRTTRIGIWAAGLLVLAVPAAAQDVLPFPEPPSASTTGKTLADSEHHWRKTPRRVPANAPNIVSSSQPFIGATFGLAHWVACPSA